MKQSLPKILPAITLAAFFAFTPITALARSSTSFPVTIHVTDQTGASVPDAKILIDAGLGFCVPSDVLESDWPVTDSHGNVTIALGRGIYTMWINGFGFHSWEGQINIGKATSMTITLQSMPMPARVPTVTESVEVIPTCDSLLTPSDTAIHELIPEVASTQHR